MTRRTNAWAGSTRKATLPPDWATRRARILKRDGYRCTETEHGYRCTAPATDVDHIDDRDDHSDSNLRSLCSPHHDAKSSAQGVQARGHGPLRNRAPQPHPGLIQR